MRVTSTRRQLHEELHMTKFTIQGSAIALLAFSICIALVLTVGACAQQAPIAGTESTVKNVVLVHGAFADGSSYAKVIPLLEAKDLNVVAVQNPLSSLADDVAATKRAIAKFVFPANFH